MRLESLKTSLGRWNQVTPATSLMLGEPCSRLWKLDLSPWGGRTSIFKFCPKL